MCAIVGKIKDLTQLSYSVEWKYPLWCWGVVSAFTQHWIHRYFHHSATRFIHLVLAGGRRNWIVRWLDAVSPHQALLKGKEVPLQAWSSPEGSRKLRFPDYMTTAQDGGKVVSLTYRPPFSLGNAPLVLIYVRGWVDQKDCQWKIQITPPWIEPATFRFVAQHLNHCATAAPSLSIITVMKSRRETEREREVDSACGAYGEKRNRYSFWSEKMQEMARKT